MRHLRFFRFFYLYFQVVVKVNHRIDINKFGGRMVGNQVKIVTPNQRRPTGRQPVHIGNDTGNLGRPMVNKYRNTPDIKPVPVSKGAGPGPLRKKGRDPPQPMQRKRSIIKIYRNYQTFFS